MLIEHHRFELLDAMRGVAALFVASLHVPPTMQRFLNFQVSYLAVDLFFCLSGFVIAFSYEERLQRGMTLGRFFLARGIRLYPLYLLGLVLGILAIIGRSHFTPHEQRLGEAFLPAMGFSLLMLPTLVGRNITSNAYPFDPPAWSLFFELLINLAYAGLVLRRRAQSWVLLVLAMISLSVTIDYIFLHAGSFNSGYSATAFLPGIPRVGYSFFAGVLICRLYKSRPTLRVSPRFQVLAGVVVMAVLAFVLGTSSAWISRPLCQLCIVVLVMPALVFVGATIRVGRKWRRPSLILGEFSYPLYILHLPLLAPLYLAQKLNLHGIVYQVLAPLIVVLLALITRWVAIYYDSPVRRYLTKKTATLWSQDSSEGAFAGSG